MKIATFNINNINKRLANLLRWLEREKPEIVCLQELKIEQHCFPADALRSAGYEAVWVGERSWNGVAILGREQLPILTRSELPGDDHDNQARYLEAAVRGVLIACIYLPNGNPQPGPKFTYKLAWFERLIGHAKGLITAGVPVVLAGDYNVVPTPQDIYPTRSLDKNALVQPASREAFQRLLRQGWTDALRKLHPAGPWWTFWDYKFERWQADKGMRLDHLLLSPQLAALLIDAGVDRWVRGEDNASDHAPAWITTELVIVRRAENYEHMPNSTDAQARAAASHLHAASRAFGSDPDVNPAGSLSGLPTSMIGTCQEKKRLSWRARRSA